GVLVGAASSQLPLGIDPNLSPVDSQRPLLVGHPIVLSAQILLMGLFAVASFGFTLQADRRPDPLIRAVGVGAALAAFARLNYFLFPSIYSDFIYTGDILRLTFYLTLLVGASREIREYWGRLEDQIKERDRLNAELEQLALTDSLTGLNNRRGFTTLGTRELQMASRTNIPVTLLFIDLNGMKLINDRYGHEQGDAALRAIAQIMRETLRTSDLSCRLGGDEFAALVNTPESAVDFVIEKLLRAVDDHNRSSTAPYKLSVSIGGAHYDAGKHSSLDDLLKEADVLMYEQKSTPSARPKLLIVDDEEDILFLLDIALRDQYEVVQVPDGFTALEAAKTSKPDLVIVDFMLPDINGLDLIPKLRAELAPRVPIVMLTSSGPGATETSALSVGADDYITKPFDPKVLRARIQRHLERAAVR
ncbi:MAG: GGDEF domain-containing response regulator, partial [Acidimicrobiia bacterium]